VSRSWLEFVLGNSQLWRNVTLSRPSQNPNIKTFLDFLSRRKNSIRHLAINNAHSRMELEAAKVVAIAKLPNLESLTLRSRGESACFDFSLPSNPLPDGSWHLKELSIFHLGDRGRDLTLEILRLTRPTLEALTFTDWKLWDKLGHLPSLKRLEADFPSTRGRLSTVRAAPNVCPSSSQFSVCSFLPCTLAHLRRSKFAFALPSLNG